MSLSPPYSNDDDELEVFVVLLFYVLFVLIHTQLKSNKRKLKRLLEWNIVLIHTIRWRYINQTRYLFTK